MSGVYPRECGGTTPSFLNSEEWHQGKGLSPRVRGNRTCFLNRRLMTDLRSIPASAGEPSTFAIVSANIKVYPRECGGTLVRRAIRSSRYGLSPRVRGNRLPLLLSLCAIGSIPASAGEPEHGPEPVSQDGVYPRECGGTKGKKYPTPERAGLSPRVRGNRGRLYRHTHTAGSIPASAGEPQRRKGRAILLRVYPRECGGTRGS